MSPKLILKLLRVLIRRFGKRRLISLAILICYCIFYIRKTRVNVYYSGQFFKEFVEYSKTLQKGRYFPHPFMLEGHIQSLMAGRKLYSDKDIFHKIETFEFSAGGDGVVHFIESANSSIVYRKNLFIVVIPGICSEPNAPYIHDLCVALIKNGFKPIIIVPRYSIKPFPLPTAKNFSLAEDIRDALDYIMDKHPEHRIIGIGHSYGGNALVNYLAEYNNDKAMLAGISISNGFDVKATLEKISGTVVESYIMGGLHKTAMNLREIKPKVKLIREALVPYSPLDLSGILRTKHIIEVDELFTRKLMGYTTKADYHLGISSVHKVLNIGVPLVSITAANDPFMSHPNVPVHQSKSNENLFFVVTSSGGHMGWDQGIFRRKHWHLSVVVEFLEWIIQKNTN